MWVFLLNPCINKFPLNEEMIQFNKKKFFFVSTLRILIVSLKTDLK